MKSSLVQTSDFARLVQQMKENGGLSTQSSLLGESGGNSSNAPKTADILNLALDLDSATNSNLSTLN